MYSVQQEQLIDRSKADSLIFLGTIGKKRSSITKRTSVRSKKILIVVLKLSTKTNSYVK